MDYNKNHLFPYLFITLAGMLLFLPFLGNVALFDWDEVNFAEIAREMIVTKDYLNVQINYQPFWEKPPLFIWMQVLSMKLFGINEFAARFPNAICGIATLLVIFSIGKKLFNQKMGLIWVMVYAGSILPFFYFKSGIIDPWFNLFIFLGIYFAAVYIQKSSVQLFNCSIVNNTDLQSYSPKVLQSCSLTVLNSPGLLVFLSGAAIGLAVLTKGPVAFLIFGLVALVYLLFTLLPSYRPTVLKSYSNKLRIKPAHLLLFLAGLLLTGGSWFMVQIAAGNVDTVKDFIIYQVRLFSTKDAGHGGFPGYHIVILLIGVFPASAFLFGGFKSSPDENDLQNQWRRIMIILLLTVVILFEIVQTKIVHYSSLAYFPLTFLSALSIYRIIEGRSRVSRLSIIVLSALALLWVLVIAGFTYAGMNKEWLIGSGLIKDPFAVANLAADVHWSGWEVLVGGVLGIGILGFFLVKKTFFKFVSLFSASIIFTFLTMTVFTGKIEGYVQEAVNEFYDQHSKEDCYINTLGFKSYAHLFYGKKMPPENPLSYEKDWLLSGKIDKPAYFVYKMTKKEEYSRIYPQLNILYEQNGFIFAARYPEKPNAGL
jgi:4-amino-4-deoxy-L-arabinose transferase-like glycosyltransferase